MKFTEAKLEQAVIELLADENYPHILANALTRTDDEVLIEADLSDYLYNNYQQQGITTTEIQTIIKQLKNLSNADLYASHKKIMRWLADGFSLKREDRTQKDIWIDLLDKHSKNNIYKFVNQLTIIGAHKRIPDGIIYINGLPLVVFEFKSAIRENASIHDAYIQLSTRYQRDIPELFKYNAFCVISDGVNNKVGSFFAGYEFYYAWRRITGLAKEVDGFDSLFTLIQGMLQQDRLTDIIQNFIYLPDNSRQAQKIICRYPQYYAARALYESIKQAQKPAGNGKGGTYFGATGCGKSFTMLFLVRLLMKSPHFNSPTIVLITDRIDLDNQLATQFSAAKNFIGDNHIISINSRAELRAQLQKRSSGGVFLTTIHKFNEDIALLSKRDNIICISDEAHRSQINLEQKITIADKGVKKTFGFAKYLHDSLPNATFVGFTGTPIDATLDVFGKVVEAYTMTESVRDEITVRIVYEGRAAKVILHNSELEKIENYYDQVATDGVNEYQIEKSKKATATMNAILGDPDRLQVLAQDFVSHYNHRVSEGATVAAKAMLVCSSREIAYNLYKNIIKLCPDWAIAQASDSANNADTQAIERLKMIMTRSQDDPKEMYDLLGDKAYRKGLDKQFKNEHSNFKIAIVVDMWLTGFDVPFLDTIYIDKPVKQHNLIQTISRVNRKFKAKNKGLVVDYIGIKKQMNLALAQYSQGEADNFEDIAKSLIIVRDHLALLVSVFYRFNNTQYFNGTALEQLNTLNRAAEYAQSSKAIETRFMGLVKRLKAAYDICTGSEQLNQKERDYIHFYLAISSIIFKLSKGNVPDIAQMNTKVMEMIQNALISSGVEEIFTLGDETSNKQDIFSKDYLEKINKIKLPNTKIKLLQQLLAKIIGEIKKVNKLQGVDFSQKMQFLVTHYNARKEDDVLRSEVYEDMAQQLTGLIWSVQNEFYTGNELGIDFEEKAFYDILKSLCKKYIFNYPEDKLIELAKAVKTLVNTQAKFPDWNKRDDIKSALKVGLILLLDKYGYPSVDKDEVYNDIFEQAENYKSNHSAEF